MKQDDKQLLLRDLCARLVYGVKANIPLVDGDERIYTVSFDDMKDFVKGYINIKPYLRQMSSMNEEEKKEFSKLLNKRYCEEDWEGHISTSYCIEIDKVYTDDEDSIKYPSPISMDAIDWLNAHHFDYRGLIPMGLALEAPKDM